MPRERSVGAAAHGNGARFDRVVEFVNLSVALVILSVAWVLVVELLAWSNRRDHHSR